MGIIVGAIFNGEVIIALSHRSGYDESRLCFDNCITRVVSFNFEPELFHVIFLGNHDEVNQLNENLSAHKFYGPSVSIEYFVSSCYRILKQQSLSTLSVLIVAFDKKPVLHLVSGRGIDKQAHERSHLLAFTEYIFSVDDYTINKQLDNTLSFSSKDDIVAGFRKVFRVIAGGMVGEISDTFHYAFLSEKDLSVHLNSEKARTSEW